MAISLLYFYGIHFYLFTRIRRHTLRNVMAENPSSLWSKTAPGGQYYNEVVKDKLLVDEIKSKLEEFGLSTSADSKKFLMARLQMAYLGWVSVQDELLLAKHFQQDKNVLTFELQSRGLPTSGTNYDMRRRLVLAAKSRSTTANMSKFEALFRMALPEC